MRKFVFFCMLAALMFSLIGASAWEAPCVSEPADYRYEDDARSIHIKKFNENGVTFFVADVQLSDASAFKAALSGDKAGGPTEPVSSIAARAGAILAVNGDDYGAHKNGVIIRNGELLRTHSTTRNMLTIDSAGNMAVRTDRKNENSKALGQELLAGGVRQTFEFGPELVRDGQAVSFSPDFDVITTRSSRLEPRTAIGQIAPLHYIVIIVDGRQDGYSAGMSLQDLQGLFLRFGAVTAMNLDGGGSTEMWFQGAVISRPSGGAERDVSDIIFF